MKIRTPKWKNIFRGSSVVFLLLIIFEIIPSMFDLVGLTQKISEQNEKIEQIDMNNELYYEVVNENKTISRKINESTLNSVGENGKMSGLIEFLTHLAEAKNISINSIKPSELMKRDNLIIQKYEIALSSSYENIYNFIRVLNNSGKVIKIKDLTLKNGEQYSSDINLKMDIDYYLNL